MTNRTTVRDVRAAFAAYRRAYALAGLGTVDRWYNHDTGESGEYRTTALDLILTEPDAYRGGSIAVSPWHNPRRPQRYPGASGHSRPAGLEMLGDTRAECVRTLRAATAALLAVVDAERPDRTLRGYAAPRAVIAADVAYLDGLES